MFSSLLRANPAGQPLYDLRFLPLASQHANEPSGTDPQKEEKEEESWWGGFDDARSQYACWLEYAYACMIRFERQQWVTYASFGVWVLRHRHLKARGKTMGLCV
jgi:hypothetical protein